MIKSITGHTTDKEVARYTKDAEQSHMAEQAMTTAYGMKAEQVLSNQPWRLDNPARKSLKRKDK